MKAKIEEFGACFSIYFEPETMEDQVALVRLGFNHTKELRGVYVDAYEYGKINSSVVIGKRKDNSCRISRK